MPVTDVQQDLDNLTLTITADFAAPVSESGRSTPTRVSSKRSGGRRHYPATFVDHDLTPGGRMTYFMTGPDGEKSPGTGRSLR